MKPQIMLAAMTPIVLLAACASISDASKPKDPRAVHGLSIENLPGATREQVQIIYYDAISLPMVRLLANPERFDGKAVKLVGVLRYEFEATALYLDMDSYEHGIATNAIFITTNHTNSALLDAMAGKYVEVTGIYEKEPASMRLNYNGHIHDVAPMLSIDVLTPRINE